MCIGIKSLRLQVVGRCLLLPRDRSGTIGMFVGQSLFPFPCLVQTAQGHLSGRLIMFSIWSEQMLTVSLSSVLTRNASVSFALAIAFSRRYVFHAVQAKQSLVLQMM